MKENDDLVIQLENKEVHECHLVEDPEAAATYNSDEEAEDTSDDENESTYEDNDDSDNDGVEVNDQGKEGEEDLEYYNNFRADNSEFDDEPGDLFDDSDLVQPLDPSQMIVGTEFHDKTTFKRNLNIFCVLNECEYKVKKSDKLRLGVWCENRFKNKGTVECHWFVFASKLQHKSTFKVKGVNLNHTCKGRIVEDRILNRSADPQLVSEVIQDKLKNGSGNVIPRPKQNQLDFKASHLIDITYHTAWKAGNLVMEAKYGSYEKSYKLVSQFCKMVCDSNKNSVATFSYCKTDIVFEPMTISFAGDIEGWKEGCRSVIGLDACHLNGKCGGVLMDATWLDGQNGLVTLRIGVLPAKTIENWTMFLTDLKPLLLIHQKPLTFISDRQKGLLEVVPAVFPDSHQRYCWTHLYNNFKKYFKGLNLYSLLWNAAKCYKKKHLYKHMEDMKKENPVVVVYLEEAGVESWFRAFFDDTSKCEHLNNNFSESFNSMVKNLRDKPVCRLGILYDQLVMSLFHKKRKESAKWDPTGLVPTALKLIGKVCKLVGAFKVGRCVSGKLYEVTNEGSKTVFIVKEKQCICLQWQLRGFVFQHVVCYLKPFRPDWTKYCSHYYTVVVYGATYSPVVLPIPSQEDYPDLEEHEDIDLEPPIKIRKSGRPRVKRRRAWMSLKHLYRHIHVQDVVPLVTTKVHVKVVMLARILKLRGKEFK
ncbi:uncharacterized protein LOC113323881 [Papaver somniferum]|uniref:uncharacterized protein LOC113323881 n=1 Tax=Papaver somniferum TaxID=3469 RepID=UPI000E702891|nr:uncharacterized protein LOC113323881 [Papaver somniferum]